MTPTDDQLDAEIDAVAREMTAGVPADSSAFRRRVLDGIDASATPRKTWRSAWVLAPLAAAAAVVIAVAMYPTTVRLKPPVDVAQARPQAVKGPDITEARPPSTVRLPARRRSAENLQRSSALAAVAPPPLAIAPIDVAPLGAARLEAADSIQIPRLDAITPIDVTPLGLDDSQRRDE